MESSAEKEILCLYGFPSEQWEVNLPAEEVLPEIPEPALGINFARDGMQEKDRLSLVAVHSDSWLLSVAFYFGARFGFDKVERKRLYNMINDLPTIFEVVKECLQVKASGRMARCVIMLNPVLLLVDSMADGVKTAVNSEEMMANDDDAERSVASVEDQLRKEMTVYEVDWGKISMVDAEKRLLANALEDPDNQHFVLLSDSLHISGQQRSVILSSRIGGNNSQVRYVIQVQVIPRKDDDDMAPQELRIQHIHHQHHVHQYHDIDTDQPLSNQRFWAKRFECRCSTFKHGSCNVPNGSNTAVNIEGTKVKSIVGIVEKSGSGGDGSGNNNHKSAQREATLIKFRQKREVRCFQKKSCDTVSLQLRNTAFMGSRMKPTIFSDNVAKALKTWHHTAKRNVKHGTLLAPDSPFTSRPGTPLHGSTSLMNLLHRYQNDSLDSSFVKGKLI
ncbi:PHD finger protein ALFIN-LIKE 4-like protein [Tanacetum coccineum]